jgi:hypothetical protein
MSIAAYNITDLLSSNRGPIVLNAPDGVLSA